nr:hypothetical protein [Candidatus Sigynarchaeota archaeon]
MPHESDYESRVLTMCQEVHDSIIKKLTPAQKEYNSHLYIIVRNYLRKEDFHITDIERITNRREEEIYRMLLEVGFSRVDTRYWPNFKAVIWTRHFVEDFLKLLNYPLTKNSSFNYRRIENLISDPFRIADYRNVLIGVFESESLKSFSSDTIQAVKSTIQSASSGHCSYLFKQIVSILTDEFPEILMFTKAVEEEDSRQASSQEQVTEAEQTAIPVQELIEQNKKLTEELERARANADFLDLQFDTMQARYNEQKAKI